MDVEYMDRVTKFFVFDTIVYIGISHSNLSQRKHEIPTFDGAEVFVAP